MRDSNSAYIEEKGNLPDLVTWTEMFRKKCYDFSCFLFECKIKIDIVAKLND